MTSLYLRVAPASVLYVALRPLSLVAVDVPHDVSPMGDVVLGIVFAVLLENLDDPAARLVPPRLATTVLLANFPRFLGLQPLFEFSAAMFMASANSFVTCSSLLATVTSFGLCLRERPIRFSDGYCVPCQSCDGCSLRFLQLHAHRRMAASVVPRLHHLPERKP
jgi:hypothetical protein